MDPDAVSPPTRPSQTATTQSVRIWDLPTRLFHWTLATCVLGALVTGSQGGDALVWHLRFGQSLLALLAFRWAWAFAGGRWSRFSNFQWRPGQGSAAGHAFPGSWAVLAMLTVLSLQVATGLMADDEIATTGPLTALVPQAWVHWATTWHKGWGEVAVWSLVGLHLSAIAWYVARGRSLIEPMVGGDRVLAAASITPSSDDRRHRMWAVAWAAGAVAFSVWVFRLGGAV